MVNQFFDPFGTHLPTLLKAVALTTGPVLEIGCGMYSTFCLHSACYGRKLVSLETDPDWFGRFTGLRSDTHSLLFGHHYDAFDGLIRGRDWSVVLIDHSPAERRIVDAVKVLRATTVILHDTESNEYGYAKVFPQ